MVVRGFVLCVAAAGFGGCSDGPLVCTTESVPGLRVSVRDAATDADLSATAVGVAREGSYEEVLQAVGTSAGLLVGAYERAGTYVVTISHPGYATWSQSNVLVSDQECHVRPVDIDARLVTEP